MGKHVDADVGEDEEELDPDAEELLRIEDDLPIEQILLYRSIARALAIHDFDEMPKLNMPIMARLIYLPCQREAKGARNRRRAKNERDLATKER